MCRTEGILNSIACSVPDRDDECVEHMEGSEGERYQSQLFPAQHPAVQPVREAPWTHIFLLIP